MGLSFANDSTDRIRFGANTALNDLVECTVAAWFRVSSFSSSNFFSVIAKALTDYSVFTLFDVTNNGALDMSFRRATTDLKARSANSLIATNTDTFCAWQYKNNGINADQKLFHGSHNGSNFVDAAEVPSYALQTVGSGSLTSNASALLGIGNMADGTASQGGSARVIYQVALWSRLLTTQDLIDFQKEQKLGSNCLLHCHLGYLSHETAWAYDLTGNGNLGNVISPTHSAHPSFLVRYMPQGASRRSAKPIFAAM